MSDVVPATPGESNAIPSMEVLILFVVKNV